MSSECQLGRTIEVEVLVVVSCLRLLALLLLPERTIRLALRRRVRRAAAARRAAGLPASLELTAETSKLRSDEPRNASTKCKKLNARREVTDLYEGAGAAACDVSTGS